MGRSLNVAVSLTIDMQIPSHDPTDAAPPEFTSHQRKILLI